jgi:hypothetical protein
MSQTMKNRLAGSILFCLTVSSLCLMSSCSKTEKRSEEMTEIRVQEPVGLPWYSHNLNPELPDKSPLILKPDELIVPEGWQKTIRSASPLWSASIEGPCPLRKEVGISLQAGAQKWNVVDKLWVTLDVANKGKASVLVRGGLRHPLGPIGAEVIAPGEKRTLAVLIIRKLSQRDAYLRQDVPKVAGLPGGYYEYWRTADADAVNDLKLHVSAAASPIALELSNPRAVIDFRPPTKEILETGFIPYVDRFGQNRYETWSGKITSVDELRETAAREKAELGKQSRVKSWDQYGGWSDGPKLEATGHFRVQKNDGSWWFVDPEGRLFWSFGVNCVIGQDYDGILATTTPSLQDALKTTPPGEPQPAALPGVSNGHWSPYMANLFRKFGDSWHPDFISTAHRRIEAWGMNTLGNWSEAKVVAARQTPYVRAVHYKSPALSAGKTYFQAGLPDLFDPRFTENLNNSMARAAANSAEDPWCIGYFVDNEMPFKSIQQIADEIIKGPPQAYTKKAFLQRLVENYTDVGALNNKWGTAFTVWEDFLNLTELPGGNAFREDARSFAIEFLNHYYELCYAAVKRAAPNKLYLGSRANHFFKELFEACAAHTDVISINLYDYSPVAVPLLETLAVDKPILIGEFHFGTLTEQGVWGPGLAQAKDIVHSARLLQRFIEDCVANPRIVGAHWFQFADQPLSGRGDRENFRVGFVNIVDIPYAPMVQASRALGERMYETRSKIFSNRSR